MTLNCLQQRILVVGACTYNLGGCVQVHSPLPVPSAFDLKTGRWGAETCWCDSCLPSQREAAGAISRAGAVCLWLWLMLSENCPVDNAKSLSSWAILGRGSVGKSEGGANQALEQETKDTVFCLVLLNFIVMSLKTAIILVGVHDNRREEIRLVAAGFLLCSDS